MDVVNPLDTGNGSEGGGGEGGDDGSMMDVVDPNCNVKNCAKQVALGLEHACALLQDGNVRCWGLNSLGQLGYGDAGMQSEGGAYFTSNVGYQVQNLGPAKAITAGYYHTCAILQNDEVWCWGDNSYGQLALPADGGVQPPHTTPVKINAAPTGISELKAGGWHTCALAGGMVTCWGRNDQGQQGSGTPNDSGVTPIVISNPAAVANVSGVAHIGLGDQFTCVANASNVQCFGNNSFGQLARGGDAGQPPFSQTPANATGLGAMTDLAKSSGGHECALANGVQCWGRNGVGQANGMPSTPLTAPVTVMGLSGAVEVAPGGTHTCARVAGGDGGTVQCWGLNGHGQTGDMITDPEAGTATPLAVKGLVNPIQIASGWGDFSCALVQGGAVWCWGANFEGQLGRGGNATIGTCNGGNGCDATPQKVIFP
jgi:alpha-tubulin suppressor-like RCC1 family protein